MTLKNFLVNELTVLQLQSGFFFRKCCFQNREKNIEKIHVDFKKAIK